MEVIHELESLGSIEDEWRRLAEGGGNAFVTPEWFTAWFRHYGEHKTPSVVVSRAPGGAVQGIFPLARSLRGRPISLRFAGANLGDHFHPLADDGEGVTLSRLAGAFLEQQPGASTIVLDNVDAAATWWRALAAGFRRPLVTSAYRHSTLPRIDLGDTTWEEFLAARSRNFRSQVRRRERRLEREHGLRFRRTTDAGQVAQDMQTFYRLHDARWRERGGSSLNSPTARAFHTDFAAAALQRGWLRLWFLEADGDDVAAWYGWRLGDRYSYYLAGFAPEWANRDVGNVLFSHTIRSAIEEGAQQYDMLMGEEAYKSRYATSQRQVCTVFLIPRLHPARMLVAAELSGWRAARRLPAPIRRGIRPLARVLPGARSR